jgi:hypothetical protein
MDFSNFIMILLGAYLAYYALNFLYDGFIKKDKALTEDEGEVLSFVGELEPEAIEPIAVVDQEEYKPAVIEKKVIKPETEEVKKIIEQEPVVMQVESQGIPYSMLMVDSKQTFAGLF